jgi:hypothetical protein
VGEEEMRAISLWNPFGPLIFDLLKRYETRHWSTDYRGPLAIHAAKKLDGEVREDIQKFGYSVDKLAFGAVIGIVLLEDVVLMTPKFIESQSMKELSVGWWEPGRYAWKMKPINRFKVPVPAVGRQSFWDWQDPRK